MAQDAIEVEEVSGQAFLALGYHGNTGNSKDHVLKINK